MNNVTPLAPKAKKKPPRMRTDVDTAPRFSEEDVVQGFTALHHRWWRHTAALGHWSGWDDSRWKTDDKLKILTEIRAWCRDQARFAFNMGEPKTAKMLASKGTAMAVMSLARSETRLVAVKDQWDADPWVFNTPKGILDLKTGRCGPHDPEAYCTKISAAGPDDGGCALWLAFLDRIMGGNQDLISYTQRVAGYCLTGITSEHVLFFLYGSGANGKSVFVSTLAGILADYHRVASMETFMDSKSERHPTDLAMLDGARLATAIETDESRHWAEAKLKTLTGGDKITARFMRQDFFEYTPQFKLMIAGNRKPSLRTVDEAIQRRIHLIPFAVTIPPSERDTELTKKLKAEWPGILAWMTAGCLEWQRVGLAPPAEVLEATKKYLSNEDTMATWIDECCDRDPDSFETGTALYTDFKGWCERNGEQSGDRKTFNEKIENHGAREDRKKFGRGFKGLRLRNAGFGRPEERWAGAR